MFTVPSSSTGVSTKAEEVSDITLEPACSEVASSRYMEVFDMVPEMSPLARLTIKIDTTISTCSTASVIATGTVTALIGMPRVLFFLFSMDTVFLSASKSPLSTILSSQLTCNYITKPSPCHYTRHKKIVFHRHEHFCYNILNY